MITNLVDYLSQAYTRILHERRKEDAVRFPSPECKASKSLICSTSPTPIPSMLCFFHMTTGGIDESLPRPSPSRFGSSDHALLEPYFRTGEVVSRDCLHGEVSFKSMDKTEDGQTIERTHDPRTTPDRVPLIPLPLLVAQLIDIFERAGTTRTYTELHAIRIPEHYVQSPYTLNVRAAGGLARKSPIPPRPRRYLAYHC
ncbi:hypothetical protein N7494_005286 [Penicillium frequentans]|uniref:Uncharacterized protein n=1 Tax=Penicillium frequentans TaxID=3151616 RepID=A0AAD6GHA4_9EURO|nr:hypothetical protein N7494_005286 [Penicillium glabrum]